MLEKECIRIGLTTAGLLLVMATGIANLSAQAGESGPTVHEIVVNEGTSMSVAVSPDGRLLAIDLQGSIWLVPIDGGEARRITGLYNDARQPVWSPNGEAIAFQGYGDGHYGIWLLSLEDGTLVNLTADPFDYREPSWSRDGSRIALSSDRGGEGYYDIWLLDVDSRQLTRVTQGSTNDFMPSWSPDDSEVAFASDRPGGRSIWAVSLATGVERSLTEGERADAPSWGPSGALIYHSLEGGRSELKLDGEPLTSEENAFPFRVSWISPTEFVYVADGKLRRRSIGGDRFEQVEFHAMLEVTERGYSRRPRDFHSTESRQVVGVVNPQISPNGRSIVFAALGEIWLLSIDDGRPVRLTEDRYLNTDPAWSPDGTMVVYASDRGGEFLDLWVRDLRTGAERQVTWLSTSATSPAWSPDGRSIAFLNVDGSWRRANISVLDVETGSISQIHGSLPGPGAPTWSPDSRQVAVAALEPYSSRFREGLNRVMLLPVSTDAPAESWLSFVDEHQSIDSRAGAGPVWLPDGSGMAIVHGGKLAFLSIDDDGESLGAPSYLTEEIAHAPSWTADSRYVLYQSLDRLRLLDTVEGTTRDIPVDLTYSPLIPTGRMMVRAGALVDGISPEVRRDIDIVIERNRILSVQPRGSVDPSGMEVVDASNLVVMPGLIDFHTHLQHDLGEAHGRAWLAFGVTTVRSPGGTPYEAVEIREAIESGFRTGPRVFSAGYLLEWRRAYYKMAVAVTSDEHLALELERARVLEHDLVKSYVRMPDFQQREIVAFAHRVGIPAASHEIYPAALSGIDVMEHTGATSRRGYSPKVSTLGRSYADVAAILGAARMDFSPTMALSNVWVRALAEKQPALRSSPRLLLVPEWLRSRAAVGANPPVPPAGGGPAGEMVMHARSAGARIVASTDSPFPADIHAELTAYVEAGMSPFEALQTATVNSAAALGLNAGTIVPGQLADLVIIGDNPLEDITRTVDVRIVIANGRIFHIDDLLSESLSPPVAGRPSQ